MRKRQPEEYIRPSRSKKPGVKLVRISQWVSELIGNPAVALDFLEREVNMRRALTLNEEIKLTTKTAIQQLRRGLRTLGKISSGTAPPGLSRRLTPRDMKQAAEVILAILKHVCPIMPDVNMPESFDKDLEALCGTLSPFSDS